ncbi:MAG: hypothetical protein ACFE9Z_06840 [Promethearchaeota archaeon]
MDYLEEISSLKKQLQSKDSLIKLKDSQVKTLENSIELKDEQIKTFEKTLQMKDEETKTLEKTISIKDTQIEELSSSKVDTSLIKEKEEIIAKLQQEIEILNEELSKADEDLEILELEIEKLKKAQINSSEDKIIDFTNIQITKSEILKKMREILDKSIANVTIIVPSIVDLQELYLYELRSSVSIKIACSISPEIQEHSELLEEFESLDNIALRNYERADRYVLTRDGEELLLAVIGNSEDNNLVIHTRDRKHIKLFNSLSTEGWIQSRKV